MKRREFIKSSLLALGGTALMTTGCGKNKLVKAQGQVVKRKYKDINTVTWFWLYETAYGR